MATKLPKTTAGKAKPKGPRAKAGPTTARVELMRREALRLVNLGYNCPQIADALTDLGFTRVSRQRAWQLVTEEMDLLAAETLEDAAKWRLKLTARHEGRLKALNEAVAKATDPATLIAAIDKAKGIDIEIGKLWGAYAATRTELTGADGNPLVTGVFAVPLDAQTTEAWTARAVAQSAGEEEEAERLLGKPGTGSNEATPAA
jgi:hypothetical protein